MPWKRAQKFIFPFFPGANAETIARSVAPPLENAINGVENMDYITSVASNDGTLQITVIFKLGTDPDQAAINVQNRVSQVTNQLPTEVIQAGITTLKRQNSMIAMVTLTDIIFHGTIPQFNYPIMKATIAEKTHYIDLLGAPFEDEGVSYEETISAQFDLDDEFKKAGVLAVPSLGASPGWTTLAVLKAIEELDEVSDVILRFFVYVDSDKFYLPVGPAIVYGEWLGAPYPSRTNNGKVEVVDLMDSEEEFDFLQPVGKQKAYTVTASPNIFIIPQLAGKPVGRVEEKAGVGVGKMDTLGIIVKGLQAATSKQGWNKSQINILEEMSKEALRPVEFLNLFKAGEIREEASSVTIEVIGKKDGKNKRKISYCVTDLKTTHKYLPWSSTSVFSTIGGLTIETVLGLGRGGIKETGVLPVSSLSLRDELLERMKKKRISHSGNRNRLVWSNLMRRKNFIKLFPALFLFSALRYLLGI